MITRGTFLKLLAGCPLLSFLPSLKESAPSATITLSKGPNKGTHPWHVADKYPLWDGGRNDYLVYQGFTVKTKTITTAGLEQEIIRGTFRV